MRVVKKGEGEPEFSIVGSLHGDEPAGKNAIEKVLDEDLKFEKTVQFIVGNERALEKDTRYTESDLNRSFPGDKNSDIYEERLAGKIMEKVKGTKVLDIHTTCSYPLPFATFSNLNETTRDLLKCTGVKNAVYLNEHEGTMVAQLDAVLVETGFQKTAQAEANAVGVIKNFLGAQRAADLEYGLSEPDIFKHFETVEGDWKFTGENFKKVRAGEVFARRDGEKLVAKKDFYPALMSTNGYEDQLGLKAKKLEKSKD